MLADEAETVFEQNMQIWHEESWIHLMKRQIRSDATYRAYCGPFSDEDEITG